MGNLGNEKTDELAKEFSNDNEAWSINLTVARTEWKNTLRQ